MFQQLSAFETQYRKMESDWEKQPGFDRAFWVLKWCKKVRDMFDDDVVDDRNIVNNHVELWGGRVFIWRERFNEYLPTLL